jgi:hypothetical protein
MPGQLVGLQPLTQYLIFDSVVVTGFFGGARKAKSALAMQRLTINPPFWYQIDLYPL